jgi:hypothetical protein
LFCRRRFTFGNARLFFFNRKIPIIPLNPSNHGKKNRIYLFIFWCIMQRNALIVGSSPKWMPLGSSVGRRLFQEHPTPRCNPTLQMELVLGVQFRHQFHLECELTVEKMWEESWFHSGTGPGDIPLRNIRATFRRGKGPGLFHSTYILEDTQMRQKWAKVKNGVLKLYLDILGALV